MYASTITFTPVSSTLLLAPLPITMPLPENEQVNAVADDLVDTIREFFGASKSIRPVHARGQLTKGTFVPSPGARYLSKAPIFRTASTPLLARFSCDTGYKDIPDTHIDSNPRGLAVRFLLSEDGHTHFDLITNTAIGFAVDRGEGFRDMFKAQLGKITEEQLHKDWPHVAWYGRNRKPLWPMSFASEQWHGIHAFTLDAEDGQRTYFRTRLVSDYPDWFVTCSMCNPDISVGPAPRRDENGQRRSRGEERNIPL